MDDEPVKHGHLLFFAPAILKRAWQRKYFALYRASGYAVQRAEMFESQELFLQNASSKIVALNDCVKVAQAPQKNQQNVFEVITKMQTFHFSAETTQELGDWVSAFQKVAFGDPSSLCQVYEEEKVNEIYSPIYGSERFNVQVMETEAAAACGLAGHHCQLVVNQLELLLCESGSGADDRCLIAWSYRHIRRYGRNKDVFTFEAGRKCASGEGTFKFKTNEANTIFQSVQANTKNIKREGEDAFGRTGSSRSIPSAFPRPDDPPPSDPPPPRRSESVDFLSSRVKSRPPPFAKPPRKSKGSSGGGDDSARIVPEQPVRFEISKAARVRLAKGAPLPLSHSFADSDDASPCHTPDATYSEPVLRTDAWKTYGQEVEHFHEERIADDVDEEVSYYASVPLTPLTRSPPGTDSSDCVLPKMLNMAVKRLSIDGVDCYDHLSQFSEPPSAKSTDSGHIYTRLGSTSGVVRSASQESRDLFSDGLPRFVQNDDIYTVVLKPPRKTQD